MSVLAVAINGKPTVISTFAGTGGSSLGYKWAGFHELLAIDFDAHAVECFRLNFPEVPVWHKSVTDITGKEIMDFCGIKWGELDVFDGSPPCQGFSTAGKREVRDPRNDLFMQYCRLIDELGPKVFVMENVTGMAKGPMKGRFIEIIQTLKGMNYVVKCKQMNAMYYGVPQARERIIFIGVRKDLNKIPTFPIPNNRIRTVKDAFNEIKNNPMDTKHLYQTGEVASIIKEMRPGECGATAHSRLFKTSKRKWFGLKRLHFSKPANTLVKQMGSALIHPSENRIISMTEAKAICSFPLDWKLPGNVSDQWARLGNAVMPKFMQAIAETIKNEILEAVHDTNGAA